jgi:ectoine hydroxylase-related dioxygenase (phytanoyl-CoA dioxygenase family)
MSTITQDADSRLSAQKIQQFERDGYLCPIRALTDEQVTRYLRGYHEYTARNKERLAALKANERYLVLSQTHYVLPWAHELVTTPRILDIMEGLLGPNLLVWDTSWFSKMPMDKAYVSWHQDGTYWRLDPPMVVTAWVALTPATPVTGCMRVIPGTHKTPLLPQRETYKEDNALSRGQEIAVEVDEKKAVDLALKPGEMSLHHIWIVHGSNANRSPDTPRIGIAIRYTRPEVKQHSPSKPIGLLVRGEDHYGNFELVSGPTKQLPPDEEQAAHAEIVQRIRKPLMMDAKRNK